MKKEGRNVKYMDTRKSIETTAIMKIVIRKICFSIVVPTVEKFLEVKWG